MGKYLMPHSQEFCSIANCINSQNDACHEKTDLKVFVVVIPKEGWARVAAPILLLVRHRQRPLGLFSHDTRHFESLYS